MYTVGNFSMVAFVPLNIINDDNIAHVLATVDHAIQYGEHLEVRGADYEDDVREIAELFSYCISINLKLLYILNKCMH